MNGVSAWILSITGIILVSLVVEIILPNGKTNNLIKSIVSIFSVLIIISPLNIFIQSGVNHFADIAVDIGVKAVKCQTDSVIGDAVLRVVVGSYLFASVSASDHRASRARNGVFLLGAFDVVKLCP